MEHKLITGGEQFLPFARSRIKALQATGLAYASQQFVIDGVSIRVRIEPGQEYIRIEGGQALLQMDSGVIDVGMVNESDPARFDAGYLVKSTAVGVYDTSFTESAKAPWWVNPAIGSKGQVSGEIACAAEIKGKIRKDGVAKSFSPALKLQGTPPAPAPDPADANLAAKKRAVEYCPPSMFTGRARLYAQAMFGQYLYAPKNEIQSNDPPLLEEISPPSLSIPRKGRMLPTRPGDPSLPAYVSMGVSAGVFFDPQSGKHWLMCPANGSVTVYPLVSSQAGESLRAWLKGVKRAKVSNEDATNIEAYILSACRPKADHPVIVALSTAISNSSMGYGWHWNWSGTQADMVVNKQVDSQMESIHYRLTMQSVFDVETKETSWSASIAIVSGPTPWVADRSVCCITEPSWQNRQALDGGVPVYWSEKTPALGLAMFECQAPIYAFYKKDELQVATIHVTRTQAIQPSVNFSKNYAIFTHPEIPGDLSYTVQHITFADQDGYLKHSFGIPQHWQYTLSCGGKTVTLPVGKSEVSSNSTISDKVRAASLTPSGGWSMSGPYVEPYPYGDPDPDTGLYASVSLYGYVGNPRYWSWSFNTRTWSQTTSSSGNIAAVIPFYDSEAIYLSQNIVETTLKTSRTKTPEGATFEQAKLWQWGTDIHEYTWRFSNEPTSSGATVAEPNDLTEVISGLSTSLVYRSAIETILDTPPSIDSIFANPSDDYVAETFKTLSSARFESPVVQGITGASADIESLPIIRPAFVGWA